MGRRMRKVPLCLVLLALASLALVVAGCAQKPAPATRAGDVPAETQAAIVTAMKAKGVKIATESSLRMKYAGDKDHVTVSGGGMQAVPSGGKGEASVASVQMRRVGGKWQIASVSGSY